MPDCTQQHCSVNQCSINCTCKQNCYGNGQAIAFCTMVNGVYTCCSCYCSCMVFGTLVESPTGLRQIQDFQPGDMVLAAGADLNFVPAVVEFSNGTGSVITQPLCIRLKYGNQQEIVVTSDHVFYLYDGTIKMADTLVLTDQLIDAATKQPVTINSIDTETVHQGFHHIATSLSMPESLDGHLINAGGIVSGDYALQIWFNDIAPTVNGGIQRLAVVGSTEYRQRNPGVLADIQVKSASEIFSQGPEDDRLPHTLLSRSIEIPERAASFVTNAQSKQIRDFVPARSYDNSSPIYNAEYIISVSELVYPGVKFLIDWPQNKGNAYSWEDDGELYVVITGGLLRATPISMFGIALILSHELGHLFGVPQTTTPKIEAYAAAAAACPPPGFDYNQCLAGCPAPTGATTLALADQYEYACEGLADYYGASTAMRRIWYGDLYPLMMIPAINEMQVLFGFLSDKEHPLDDPCANPTLDCRIKTFEAALTLAPWPACAGGAATTSLKLELAEATSLNEVNVTFNIAVNKETAEVASRYTIRPGVKVASAVVSPDDGAMVTLTLDTPLDQADQYRLRVKDIISESGLMLDPAKSAVDFQP